MPLKPVTPKKFSIKTIQLATAILTLDDESKNLIYATLGRAVYGMPSAVNAPDLLHALAEMMGKPIPEE
jgi:hypothetical protein